MRTPFIDFKYSDSPRLTWWFDHHKSAFLSPEDEAHFRADTSGKKFLDAGYKSCARFIAETAQRKFGFDAAPMGELIHWANKIDGALYESAAEPVEMRADAFKLALVIENERDQQLIERVIRDLQTRPLGEVAKSPYIAGRVEPLYERHLRSMEIIKQNAEIIGPVVFFDVVGHDMEGYSKFVPYYLYPRSDLQRQREPLVVPLEGLGGVEPMGAAPTRSRPGGHLRTLRRGRARGRGRDFARA